jgi:hypothetical protein
MTQDFPPFLNPIQLHGPLAHDCSEIQKHSEDFRASTTENWIQPLGENGSLHQVTCDFTLNDGGWTVIQKRLSGPKEEFHRNWTDYESGFRGRTGNYWIGLEAIRALTYPQPATLRIEIALWNGTRKFAQFSTFSVYASTDAYRLWIDGYSGNAGDSQVSKWAEIQYTGCGQ